MNQRLSVLPTTPTHLDAQTEHIFSFFQVAFYVCSHVGMMFDWEANKQQLLQGHVRCSPKIFQFFLLENV